MCLFVKYVPTSERAANCVPCFKLLKERTWSKGWITPFIFAEVPKSGILKPERQKEIDPIKNMAIEGGVIHAREKRWSDIKIHGEQDFPAYAFGVKAYGHDDDLCAAIVYVPAMDKSSMKSIRMRAIRRWEKLAVGPTNAQVRKVFPKFKTK